MCGEENDVVVVGVMGLKWVVDHMNHRDTGNTEKQKESGCPGFGSPPMNFGMAGVTSVRCGRCAAASNIMRLADESSATKIGYLFV